MTNVCLQVGSIDGKKVDSSRDRREPFLLRLGVGALVDGLDAAIGVMSLGQECRITVPPAFAYGKGGLPPLVPPDTPLVFQIQLLAFGESVLI